MSKLITESPLPEKRSPHFPVERAGTIPDHNGDIGDPFRSIGTLEIMLRRGTIDREMAEAGDQFHIEFQIAHLEPLKAADFARTRVSGRLQSILPLRIEHARDSVWRALKLMGGVSSPCGSIAWEVLGRGGTLNQWAQSETWAGKPLRRQISAGIMIGTLGILVEHYKPLAV